MPLNEADILLRKQFALCFTSNCFSIAAIGIACYDYVVTFPSEIRCIWQRKLDIATFLLFVIRYATLLDVSMWSVFSLSSAISAMPDEKEANFMCIAIWRTNAVISILIGLATATLIALRICAVWSRNIWVFLFILFIHLAPVVLQFYEDLTFQVAAYPLPFMGCLNVKSSHSVPAKQYQTTKVGIGIAAEGVILIFTFAKTLEIRKFLHGLSIERSISGLLLRDGTLYFLILLVIYIGDLVALLRFNFAFDTLSVTIRSILITRLMFNLREVFLTSNSALSRQDNSPSAFSQLDFARTVFGNIGAPLATSRSEETEDGSFIRESAPHDQLSLHEDQESISNNSQNATLSLYSPMEGVSQIGEVTSKSEDVDKGYVCFGEHGEIVVVDIKYGYI